MNSCRYIPLLLILVTGAIQGNDDSITISVLYDNTPAIDEVQTDWGFACLVEGLEQTILFDTGRKSEVLLHNSLVLSKDMNQIDILVLTHDHGDHTGGLTTVLEHNPGLTVYFPSSFPALYDTTIRNYDAQAVRVSDAIKLFTGVGLTGELGSQIIEQALILETEAGLEHTTELYDQDIYLVLGGFHLLRHTDEQVRQIIARFKELGVEKVGATHCTGERAIKQFQQVYGEKFVPVGAGRVVEITR